MTSINDHFILTMLMTKYPNASIRVLDWNTDHNIVKPGANYAAKVSRLTIRYQHDHHPPKTTVLFVKIPSNAASCELVRKSNGYENEILIYTTVLPQMRLLDDDSLSPRYYYSDDTKALFLQDLTYSGYQCACQVEQLDLEHCIYALRRLAKFHALSVKLQQTVGLPDSVKSNPYNYVGCEDNDAVNSFVRSVPMFAESLPQHLQRQYPEIISYMRSFDRDVILQCVSNASQRFSVLNHGDFWTNNIMFKYDKFGNVEKAKLIDFQLTKWTCPANDLVFFTVSSMKFETYRKHFSLLMNLYVDSLNETLSSLGCPTYSVQSLRRDIDAIYPITLMVLCSGLAFLASAPNHTICDEQNAGNDSFVIRSLTSTYKQMRFKEISQRWFVHLAQTGSLWNNEEIDRNPSTLPHTNNFTQI